MGEWPTPIRGNLRGVKGSSSCRAAILRACPTAARRLSTIADDLVNKLDADATAISRVIGTS